MELEERSRERWQKRVLLLSSITMVPRQEQKRQKGLSRVKVERPRFISAM